MTYLVPYLNQAEAQVRESQIQLALERVRARTMAMHKSEELAETAQVLFQECGAGETLIETRYRQICRVYEL